MQNVLIKSQLSQEDLEFKARLNRKTHSWERNTEIIDHMKFPKRQW